MPVVARDLILETAPERMKAGQVAAFEDAFRQAQRIMGSMPGYVSRALERCIERPEEYILPVTWRSLEDHEAGFRGSPGYQAWKQLLHHFYEPFPVVSHYVALTGAAARSGERSCIGRGRYALVADIGT